jgi:hypothetical protein
VRYGISRANVGYRLLKKAGWTEGTGLGAQEQGAAEPIQAFQQKGSLGLGYALQPPPKPPPAGGAAAEGQQAQRAQQQPKRPLPEDPLDKEDSTTKVKRVRQVSHTCCHAGVLCRLGCTLDFSKGFRVRRHAIYLFPDTLPLPTAAPLRCDWLRLLRPAPEFAPLCPRSPCSPSPPHHPTPDPTAPPCHRPDSQVMQAEADDRAGKAIARYIRLAFNDATGEPTRDSNPLLRRNHKLSATNPLL